MGKEEITIQNLKELFPEFLPFEDQCQYLGCAHIKDAGCAVLEALEEEKIEKTRYESYKKMFEELESVQKYK